MGCEWQDLRLTVLRESPAAGKPNVTVFLRWGAILRNIEHSKGRNKTPA
jgi:hypothetical protein